jgi:hypothetical protein
MRVYVPDLSALRRFFHRHKFVSGDYNSGSGPAVDRYRRYSQGSKDANLSGVQDGVSRNSGITWGAILAFKQDVFTGGYSVRDLQGGTTQRVAVFLHHHAVRTFRQGGAGYHFGALAALQAEFGNAFDVHMPDYIQVGRAALRGAESIRSSDSVTVHAGSVERRNVLSGRNVPGKHPAAALPEGNELAIGQGWERVKQRAEFLHAYYLKELVFHNLSGRSLGLLFFGSYSED